MNSFLKRSALAISVLAIAISGGAQAQDSEIEQLRREYEQRLRVMQQAFEEKLEALEAKVDQAAASSESVESSASSGAGNEFTWYWKEGLKFDSNDGAFKLKFNGRIQLDNAFYDEDDAISDVTGDGPWGAGTEFRRVRLEVAGDIYDDIYFKAQFDFAGDSPATFKDVYMGMKTNVGDIRVGHFKEPFSLDELTSSKDIQFMERALPNAFAPGRNTGIQYSNSFLEDRMTFAAGLFRDSDDFGDSDDGSSLNLTEDALALTARLTGLPYTNEDHTQMIHVGAALSFRSYDEDVPSGDALRYRARPESHITSARLVNTGRLTGVEDATLIGLEAAGVYNRFAAQAEYIHADHDFDESIAGIDSASFDGYYIQGSYFLTDDSRNYKASSGIFDKVKPNTPFSLSEPGMGAWEVLARYSHLDLDDTDEGIAGGEENNFTLALNWYLNPNVRVGLNYINANVDAGMLDDDVNILQSRFQVTW